jgi:hypothetical protein
MAEETQSVQITPSREDKKCQQEGCKRPYRAKGYCNVHYKQWRHGKFAKARYKICTKEGCRKPRAKGSVCAEHATGAEATAA